MTRWALLFEYDGTPFVGWQRQAVGISVQGVMEEAASHLVGRAAVAVNGAGRTDSGVHAAGQVAHLDLPSSLGGQQQMTGRRLRDALNYHMKPHPIAVLAAAVVAEKWSARFSAINRRYRYRILNRPARPALDQGRVWHVKQELDLDRMREAALMLMGRHDFTSFRASACQAKSPIRTLDRLQLCSEGGLIDIHVEARSFLHHQVRNIVGTLKLVGEGKWTPDQVATALEARDRAAAGPTAPPDGLFLMEVGYETDPFVGPAKGP